MSSGTAALDNLAQQFCSVRQQMLSFCELLTAEDLMVQSCAEASPGKWHLAHTTWFYETFILREYQPGYRAYHPDFVWLFNSYYNSISEHPEKKLRASFSRPPLEAILGYREYVDAAMQDFLDSGLPEEARERLVLGLNHEQQHLELLATDIKHALLDQSSSSRVPRSTVARFQSRARAAPVALLSGRHPRDRLQRRRVQLR